MGTDTAVPVHDYQDLKPCQFEMQGLRLPSGRRNCTIDGAPPCGCADPEKCEFAIKQIAKKNKRAEAWQESEMTDALRKSLRRTQKASTTT